MFLKIIKHREKVFYMLCGIICVAFVLSYAVTNIATISLLLLFFTDKKSKLTTKLRYIKSNRIIWLYIGFFIVQAIGLLYTQNLEEGLRRLTVMLPIVFLPAVIFAETKNSLYFNKLLSFLQYTIPLIFLILMLVHLFYDQRTISEFVHFTVAEKLGVSQFYLVFVLIIPFLVSYSKLKNRNYKIFNGLLLLISLVLIMVLGNKMTIIMLFILTLTVLLKNIRDVKKATLTIASAVLLGAISYNLPIVKERFTTLFKTTDFNLETIITKNSFTVTKNTLEHRILIDYLSSREIINALPFGVGTGDVQDTLNEQYKTINFKAGVLNNFNNHNQYFSEFLKTGIIGGVLFIVLLYVLNKRATSSNSIALTFTVFFTLACLIESYLYRQHGVIIFTFLIPLFLTHKTINLTK